MKGVKKLNKEASRAIAYCYNALNFLFMEPEAYALIDRIYLHGSAIRGALTEKSDIDMFIDTADENARIIEKMAISAISRFYKSNDYEKWKRLGFLHTFSVMAGTLETWELKQGIMAEGILLYSKKMALMPAERKVLFIFKIPKIKKKYLKFTRLFFGRKEEGYKDKGILGKVKGEKVSANVIIVPKEYQQETEKALQKESIDYSMKEICLL
ncbi:MAG: nucleotidyltransferase domain-containing protein [Candidatus Nanoarchaeia archaeon]|nr:nucleotidyltransferase domain-containing protein [Candidatus Nanoarchaeia archaeon]